MLYQKEQIYHYLILILFIGLLVLLIKFFKDSGQKASSSVYKELEVTATAYNSTWEQTIGHPAEAAWGDTLKPGMKAIAVSRDLIDSGLTHGTMVEIGGLPGKYEVLDKMNARWKMKIDIYMGTSEEKAREWGKKKVTIRWEKNDGTME
jgi:3D (Asp-Asp-Asp) domain-containing protein